jgi:hypothetical protein
LAKSANRCLETFGQTFPHMRGDLARPYGIRPEVEKIRVFAAGIELNHPQNSQLTPKSTAVCQMLAITSRIFLCQSFPQALWSELVPPR